jgi:hypothetical protein
VFETNQYLIERKVLSNKNKKIKLIKNSSKEILGSYEPANIMGIVIKDTKGNVQAEVRNTSKFMHLEIGVFGPQHTIRGTIKQMKEEFGVKSMFGDATWKPSKYVVLNPQGVSIATLVTTKHERRQPFLNFNAPDGELLANVSPSSMGDFVKIEVKRNDFDPLFAMAFVMWFDLYGSFAS